MSEGKWTSNRARAASLDRWALEPDPSAATQKARDAFLARFEKQVDPDGTLDPAERHKRAERAKRAYFLRLAEQSAAARRKAKGEKGKRT